ncbi:hypothetical protein K438DRAFT_1763619 [Mycena galopus ATCC 62051]|nr:hypothetical protein K438DRAFT_1763619 [Mycena galopus ATCC 62051]
MNSRQLQGVWGSSSCRSWKTGARRSGDDAGSPKFVEVGMRVVKIQDKKQFVVAAIRTQFWGREKFAIAALFRASNMACIDIHCGFVRKEHGGRQGGYREGRFGRPNPIRKDFPKRYDAKYRVGKMKVQTLSRPRCRGDWRVRGPASLDLGGFSGFNLFNYLVKHKFASQTEPSQQENKVLWLHSNSRQVGFNFSSPRVGLGLTPTEFKRLEARLAVSIASAPLNHSDDDLDSVRATRPGTRERCGGRETHATNVRDPVTSLNTAKIRARVRPETSQLYAFRGRRFRQINILSRARRVWCRAAEENFDRLDSKVGFGRQKYVSKTCLSARIKIGSLRRTVRAALNRGRNVINKERTAAANGKKDTAA